MKTYLFGKFEVILSSSVILMAIMISVIMPKILYNKLMHQPLTQLTPIAANPLLSWKKYTNDTYSFSIQYPPTWQISEGNNYVELIADSPTYCGQYGMLVDNLHLKFTEGIYLNNQQKYCNSKSDCISKISDTQINISDSLANKFNYHPFAPGGTDANSLVQVVLINKNNKYIILSHQMITQCEQIFKKTFDQILSTFKFLK